MKKISCLAAFAMTLIAVPAFAGDGGGGAGGGDGGSDAGGAGGSDSSGDSSSGCTVSPGMARSAPLAAGVALLGAAAVIGRRRNKK